MNALVTGADGFLGANLCKTLVEQGHAVVGSALNRKGHTSLDALGVDIRIEYGDVLDAAFVARLVNAYEAEWVFHLAGVSIVRIAEKNPQRCIQTNALGTLNVLEACRQAGHVKAALVASSDKAYGDYGGAAYREGMGLKPAGAYEVSKACADLIAQCYGTQYGLRAIVTRCANLYGPGDLHWSRLVPNSCRLALQGQGPQITPGAWKYQRHWLYVDDAVQAYITLAEQGEAGQAYNVAPGPACVATAGGVGMMIARMADAPEPVEGSVVIGHEIPAQELDAGKIEALGWQAQTQLVDGLRTTLDWYRGYLRGD